MSGTATGAADASSEMATGLFKAIHPGFRDESSSSPYDEAAATTTTMGKWLRCNQARGISRARAMDDRVMRGG